MADQPPNPQSAPAPLSADRLRSAFARMLEKPANNGAAAPQTVDSVSPEGIVEALLFVGRADGAELSAEAIADSIRDTDPTEVDAIVQRLRTTYEQDRSARQIERSNEGYRMALAEGFDDVADRFRGRARTSRLSRVALETLALVAYRQPIAAGAVEELRGARSASALAHLVRRGLLRIDSQGMASEEPHYTTTDRFLESIGLTSLDQLPRVAELED